MEKQAQPPAGVARPDGSKSSKADPIEELYRRHAGAKTYRAGCHELSTHVRARLEASAKERATRWSRRTARELRRELGAAPEIPFFELLERHQFGRREPDLSAFRGACDLARAVVGLAPPAGSRRKKVQS